MPAYLNTEGIISVKLSELPSFDLLGDGRGPDGLLISNDGRCVCVLTVLSGEHSIGDTEGLANETRQHAERFAKRGLTRPCQPGYLAYSLSDLTVPANLLFRMTTFDSAILVFADKEQRAVLAAIPAVRDENGGSLGRDLALRMGLTSV